MHACDPLAPPAQGVVDILIEMGALEPENLQVQPLGLVARSIQVRAAP